MTVSEGDLPTASSASASTYTTILPAADIELETFHFPDRGQSGGATERVAEKRARVDRFALRFRPAIHHRRAADAR